MKYAIKIRKPRQPDKPHHPPGHVDCCERIRCIVWKGELPFGLRRGRTDFDQVGAARR